MRFDGGYRCAALRDSATFVREGKNSLRILAIVALLAIAGCAKPPKISATLDITRRAPDTVLVMLLIKNLENRATTPLAPEVVIQTRSAGAWDKPVSQIHPVAFVLNRQEQRDIFKVLHTSADLVRASVTIKEQENGHLLMNRRFEKAVPVNSAAPPAP